MRDAGIVVFINIQYTNFREAMSAAPNVRSGTRDTNVIVYFYQVKVIQGEEYKAEMAVGPPGTTGMFQTNRTVYNFHGVRVIVTVGGRIGTFSWQHLLVSLTTSIGLLTLSSIAIDLVLSYCTPLSPIY